MIDWNTCNGIERHSGKMGGVWVFQGTRVPVYALLENLKDGASIEQFQEWFPGVEQQQIEAFLQHILHAFKAPPRP